MRRNRQTPDYVGRHRIHRTSNGNHKRDALPPPDEQPGRVPGLVSEEAHGFNDWHDVSRLPGIDPDIVSPTRPEEAIPIQPQPAWAQPKKKIKTKRITIATLVLMFSIPAIWLASSWQTWAGDAPAADTHNAQKTEYIQTMLYRDDGTQERTICVVLRSTAPLNATIYDSHC